MPGPDATSSKFPVRPTFPIASCARSRRRRSIIADPIRGARARGARRRARGVPDDRRRGRSIRRPALAAGKSALVNTLSPGDRVLAFEIGEFARLWSDLARRLGLDRRPGRYRLAARRRSRRSSKRSSPTTQPRASRPSSSSTTRRRPASTCACAQIRQAMDRAKHPALLMVDAVSSLASIDLRHDEWRIDVTDHRLAERPDAAAGPRAAGHQREGAGGGARPRGCRAPTGPGSRCWPPTRSGYFTYTPATNLLYGLRESLRMLEEEGLQNVFARHARLAEAARRAVAAWRLELCAARPDEYSNTVTTVLLPAGHDADQFAASSSIASTCRSAPASAD